MENYRPVILLLIFSTVGTFLMFPLFIYSYSGDTTHPALTSETVKFFNKNYTDFAFDEGEEGLLMQGSTDEDIGTRPLQHFYDPVYNRGLTIGGRAWQSSKNWAEDTLAQAAYSFNLASVPTKALYGTVNEYFESDTDHSWERAIYEYAWGDKERALRSLGHVLHLIQDASVPDHTRNDPHPPTFEMGSPYEGWAAAISPENIDVISRIDTEKPQNLETLEQYFNSVARYSNNNFFSKDTILDRQYNTPTISYELWEFLNNGELFKFGYTTEIDGSQYKLVLLNQRRFGTDEEVLSIEDPENLILTDYWNLLSKQAVLHGAGVTRLFFEKVEEEKETKELLKKNRNWSQKLFDATVGDLFNFAGRIYGSSVTYEELQELTGEQQGARSAESDISTDSSQKLVLETTSREENPGEEEQREEEVNKTVDKPVEKPLQGETLLEGPVDEKATSIPLEQESEEVVNSEEQKEEEETNSDEAAASGGGGHIPPPKQKQEQDATPPATPVVTTPASSPVVMTNNPVLFTGTAEESSTVTARYTSNGSSVATTTIVSENPGEWNFHLELDQGTTTVEFQATDAAGNDSAATSTTVFLDSQAPSVSLSIDECTNTISVSGCLVATTTLSASWASNVSDFSHYLVDTNGSVSTTTATSTTVTAPDNAVYSFAVSAYDIYGNASATSTKEAEVAMHPIVINEVAWAGTAASSADEWVELYNPTAKNISLDNWIFEAGDGVPSINLSGTLNANSYYLIERTDDTTVSGIKADLTTPFSGKGGGSGLSNLGEDLYLKRIANNATTTMDSVPQCNGDWCGGSSSGSTYSMERYDARRQGADPDNWNTTLGEFILNGKNSAGGAIKSTPNAKNSISYKIVNGSVLAGDKTLTASGSPYLVDRDGLTIQNGVNLTAEAGVVVKVVNPNEPQILVKGSLTAKGEKDNEVVFTAFTDDDYGGDMNNDATSTAPTAGDWHNIQIEGGGSGSSLEHIIIRYGGRWTTNYPLWSRAALSIDGTDVAISNATVEHSGYHGAFLKNATSTTVSNSRFKDNNDEGNATGLYVSGGAPTISHSTFSANAYGLYIVNAADVTADANTFTDNSEEAVYVRGVIPTLKDNNGSGNGYNAITIGQGAPITSTGTVTLSANSLPYLIVKDASVASSTTLTFENGVIVKGHDSRKNDTGKLTVKQNGKLYVKNDSVSDLVFTSMHDDTAGGAVDSATTSPSVGDWYGIAVEGGGILEMEGFSLRYGGALTTSGGDDKGGIKVSGGATSTLATALIENNHQYGVLLQDNAYLQMSDSTVRNHTEENVDTAAGIRIEGSHAELSGITFSNNDYDLSADAGGTATCTGCTVSSTTPSDLLAP